MRKCRFLLQLVRQNSNYYNGYFLYLKFKILFSNGISKMGLKFGKLRLVMRNFSPKIHPEIWHTNFKINISLDTCKF